MPVSNALNNGEREEATRPVVSSAYLFHLKPVFPHPIIPVYLASQLLNTANRLRLGHRPESLLISHRFLIAKTKTDIGHRHHNYRVRPHRKFLDTISL